MEIIIHGDKIKVTEAMKSYIEEKLGRLDKYLENSDDIRATVIVKVKGHLQTMEITIPLKSFILRSEETQEDFYAAVDKTIDKLERQIRKNKTRLNRNVKESVKEFNFDYELPMEEEGKETVVKGDNKVCAILYTITTSIWIIITCMEMNGIFAGDKKIGWDSGFDISMARVCGSHAIDYCLKYRKEKKEDVSYKYDA
jgi:ribosomal subunit interface protein